MLPTTAIKADVPSTSSSAAGKDKDTAALSLEATFSAYFSQMVASLPALQASQPGSPAPDAAPRVADRPAESDRKAPAAARPVLNPAADSGRGGTPDAPSAPAAAQPGAPQAPSTPAASSPSVQADSTAAQAGSPASPAAAGTAPSPSKASQSQADPAQAGAGNSAAPVAAVVAEPQAQAAAKLQDALNQAVPGAKFQVQFGADSAPVTSKQPLSELVSPIQMVTGPLPAPKTSLPEPAQAVPAAAPAVDPAAAVLTLQALQALQAPQAGPAALLAAPAPGTGAPGAAIAAGGAAGAQAVGAAAQPGASGAVRVTASNGSAGSRPAGDPSLFSQVDGTIRWLVKNQDQGAELQLHPESLGRVQIKLKVEGSVVHAKVWASDAAAVPVLQDHRASLEASLKAQGLTLGSFDLQHGHRQQQAPLPDPGAALSAPSVRPALPATGQESPAVAVQAPTHTSRIEYVA